MAGGDRTKRTASRAGTSGRRTAASGGRAAASRRSSSTSRKPVAAKSGPRKPARSAAASSAVTLVAILLAGVALCVWAFYPVLRLNASEQRQKERFERQLADVRKSNKKLRREVAELKTPQGVEQAARERIGLVKPGENVYVVTSRPETRTPARNTADAGSGASMWGRIFSFLLGRQ